MRLEDAIGFSKKYDVKNIYDIMVKSRDIMDYLKRSYPIMSQEWYDTESYRRIKILCQTGYFKRELEWDKKKD